MLDTNICILSVTLAELPYGVAKSQYQEKPQAVLDEFILPLEVVDFDEPAALYYGALRATLEKQGTPIGSLDTTIGVHALSLVTIDSREFDRIAGLKLVDWIGH